MICLGFDFCLQLTLFQCFFCLKLSNRCNLKTKKLAFKPVKVVVICPYLLYNMYSTAVAQLSPGVTVTVLLYSLYGPEVNAQLGAWSTHDACINDAGGM